MIHERSVLEARKEERTKSERIEMVRFTSEMTASLSISLVPGNGKRTSPSEILHLSRQTIADVSRER